MKTPKVAIIGAGPAGCMLARLLYIGGVEATVFEGEKSQEARTQGGSLDLHTSTGLAAMKEAGLFDTFKNHARYDGQYMAIVDRNLVYVMVRGAEKVKGVEERPEIDRPILRDILLQSLPEGMIRWGHRLRSVEGKTLIFDHGSESGFDLIVGADGAWSKIRGAICPDLQPVYTGIGLQELFIPDAETAAPDLCRLVNRGALLASGEGRRIWCQQRGDGSIYVGVGMVRRDEDWMDPAKCGYDARDLGETQKALREEFGDWATELREAFELASGPCVPRSLYMLPVGKRWDNAPGFTLIGDAAHLMSPYAGEGVNQALDDAKLLAGAILRSSRAGTDLQEEVRLFEDAMMNRVRPIQELSDAVLHDWMFTPGAPQSVITRVMIRHAKAELHPVLHPVAVVGIHLLFFYKRLFG